MGTNASLRKADRVQNDEFYTRLEDIELELKHYKEHFKGKIVFCNCDDPFESNFFKYFAMNFNHLGLKKLICTCYRQSPVAWAQFSLFENEHVVIKTEGGRDPYKIEINEVVDYNGDGAIDISDIKWLLQNDKNSLTILNGDGDFRSEECIGLLEEADIVVTNPPFSLFREYVAQLVEHNKKYLIIGNKNAITYKEIFPLLKDNKLWIGYSSPNEFMLPDGTITKQINGLTRWFTNLDISKRHEEMILYKHYIPSEFSKYDNYNAVNVDKTADIPCDYYELMGVPITFLDKYNPDQFEIVDAINRYSLFDIQNTNEKVRAARSHTCNIDGKATYFRIIIRRKQ